MKKTTGLVSRPSAYFFMLILGCTISTSTLCLAQDFPAFDIPLLESGFNHRNNFCARHEAVERGDIPIREALFGLTNISVGFLTFQLNQETGGIDDENPDIAIEILDEIARRAGFEYRNSYGTLPPPSGNITWTEVLEWAVGVYDIMGTRFVETTDRLERNILFPAGWYDGNLILVMRGVKTDSTTVDVWALFKPFTSEVWGLIALTTLLSGFVYYVLDYFDSRIKRKNMDTGLEDSLFYAAFTFNGHYTQQPKSRGTRILVFSMAFFFLLIVAAYTANMASFLVLRNQPSLVINDIQDVIRNDLRICVQRGTASEEHLQSYRISNSKVHRTENTGEEFLALQEGLCDIILIPFGEWEEARRDIRFNPRCDLQFVGKILFFQSGGFAVGDSEQYCSSLLRDVLHLHMSELINSPMFDLIWEEYLNKGDTSNCVVATAGSATEDQKDSSMGIDNLSGMFLIHFIALGLALVLTVMQVHCQPAQQRKEMISDLQSAILGCKSLKQTASIANRKALGVIPGIDDLELFENENEAPSSDGASSATSVLSKVEHLTDRIEKSNQQNQIEVERITQLVDQLGKGEQERREQLEQRQQQNNRQNQVETDRITQLMDQLEKKEQQHKEQMEQIQRRSNQQNQLEIERIRQLVDRLEKKEQQHREQMEQSQKRHQEEVGRMCEILERMEQKEQRHLDLIEAMRMQLENMEDRLTHFSKLGEKGRIS